MLKTKVKISKINNLTDARYFAAAGVDYLGYCCNPDTEKYCSIVKIKEISEWVEGPLSVMEFDGWQSEAQIEEVIEQLTTDALHFGAFATYTQDFRKPIFKDFIFENLAETSFHALVENCTFPVIRTQKSFKDFNESELNLINNTLNATECFLDIGFGSEDISEILDRFQRLGGLILRGADEEKVGFKSFEQLDTIFEKLEA